MQQMIDVARKIIQKFPNAKCLTSYPHKIEANLAIQVERENEECCDPNTNIDYVIPGDLQTTLQDLKCLFGETVLSYPHYLIWEWQFSNLLVCCAYNEDHFDVCMSKPVAKTIFPPGFVY